MAKKWWNKLGNPLPKDEERIELNREWRKSGGKSGRINRVINRVMRRQKGRIK